MRLRNRLALAAVTVIGAACSDGSSPMAHDDLTFDTPFFSTAPAPGMDVLARTVPLAQSVGVKMEIQAEDGGTLSLPSAGITVRIPEVAIDEDEYGEDVVVALEAFAGDRVAFEFHPHGIDFLEPVTIEIDVVDTEAEFLLNNPSAVSSFLAVYYLGDGSQGNVSATETFQVSFQNGKLVFETDHFSGYAIAF